MQKSNAADKIFCLVFLQAANEMHLGFITARENHIVARFTLSGAVFADSTDTERKKLSEGFVITAFGYSKQTRNGNTGTRSGPRHPFEYGA